VNLGLYAIASGLLIWMVERYRNAVLLLKDEDARHLVLAREQRHRLHNAIAVVEAIVRHSLRGDPAEATTINRRIRAGLTDVDLQEAHGQQPVSLRHLLSSELQAFDPARFSLKGDGTVICGKSRNIAALAAHELATNAVKYGALSVPEGRVTIAWTTEAGRTTLRWREVGGPPVKPPSRRGYGSTLLRRLVEAHGGAVAIEFRRSGVIAKIDLPLQPSPRR
jgi:two-component sensor histidine kinase